MSTEYFLYPPPHIIIFVVIITVAISHPSANGQIM